MVGADCWRNPDEDLPADFDAQVLRRWGTVPLIDMLTEAVLRTGARESIRTIAAGVKGSIGVVHKTLADAQSGASAKSATQRAVAAAEDIPR